MIGRVDVAELTGDQLEKAKEARAANRATLTPEQQRMEELLVEVKSLGPLHVKRRRRAAEQPTRRCTGCGIDTTLPDLCRDCQESGWFEPAGAGRPDDQRQRDAKFFASARQRKAASA